MKVIEGIKEGCCQCGHKTCFHTNVVADRYNQLRETSELHGCNKTFCECIKYIHEDGKEPEKDPETLIGMFNALPWHVKGKIAGIAAPAVFMSIVILIAILFS